jgi:hypothetical protein
MILDEALILERELENWEASLPESWNFTTEEAGINSRTHLMESRTSTVIYEQREFGIILDGHKF